MPFSFFKKKTDGEWAQKKPPLAPKNRSSFIGPSGLFASPSSEMRRSFIGSVRSQRSPAVPDSPLRKEELHPSRQVPQSIPEEPSPAPRRRGHRPTTHMNKEIAFCANLLRQFYSLQLEVWGMSENVEGDKSARNKKKIEAKAVYNEIKGQVHNWQNMDYDWTDEQWRCIQDIDASLNERAIGRPPPQIPITRASTTATARAPERNVYTPSISPSQINLVPSGPPILVTDPQGLVPPGDFRADILEVDGLGRGELGERSVQEMGERSVREIGGTSVLGSRSGSVRQSFRYM